jgi:DNA-binding transcriptional MerR regulator
MTAAPSRLGKGWEQAISALLTHPTIGEAAAAVGVHANTLRVWMKDPRFDAAYREARRRLLDRTVGKLQHAVFCAVDTLLRDLRNRKGPGTRLQAARTLLEYAHRGGELQAARKRDRLSAEVLKRLDDALAGGTAQGEGG